MKKIVSVLLSLLFLLGCAAPAAAADAADFIPVLRFVAASDTHIRENEVSNVERIRKMMALAYDVADSDPAYPAVDALLIAGDLTNDGTKTEFDTFWATVSGALREGTQFLGVVAKNHDGYEMKRSELRAYYSALTGNDADFHTVINGYHFIGLSASEKDASHYDAGQLAWLKAQLNAAVAEDPAKPIFFTHHEPVRGTVYGSSLYDGWGITRFSALLQSYPQVVDFAGHSHYPLNDPRSIWQGAFTAVGTGAIYYSEFTVEGLRAYHPADSDDTAACWIVELDRNNRMRLRGYDVNEQTLLCEETLENPADPANRAYTPAKRKAASAAPVFDANAVLTAEPAFGSCKLTVPAAQSADGMPVVLYRATAKNSSGVPVAKSWIMPSYYRAIAQDTVQLELTGLAAGSYTVSVVAENAYGGQSLPLETRVKIDGETGVQHLRTRLTLWFQSVKDFFVHLFW